MGYIYKTNHNYFEKIDTEYKAYILGLIYADGSIIESKGNRQLKVVIGLQEEDGYILSKFAREAGGKDITISHVPSHRSKNWKPTAKITVTSDKICKKLISYGCKIRKSQEGMNFPLLEEKLIPHFIRGFFDGDGSLIFKKVSYKYKRKTTNNIKKPAIQKYKLKLAFSSTDLDFLKKLLTYLPTGNHYIAERKRKQICYTLWIEAKKDVDSCIDYLYKNCNFFLKRKYAKVELFNKTIKSQAESKLSEGLETT